jgi:hypothetical protein
VISLRAFQRYHKDATRDIIDGDGMTRWVSQKQARVQAIVDRVAMSPGGHTTMRAIALEAGVTPSTVSRCILKLQGWALYAVEVKRGKYGGVTIHRKGWDRFWDYVREARSRLKSNVASILRRRKTVPGTMPEPTPLPSTFMDATLKPLTFAQRFMYERAMLALEDPEGEDPEHPVNVDVLLGMPHADELEALRASMDKLMREAALSGDWATWERIKVERWPNGYGKQ